MFVSFLSLSHTLISFSLCLCLSLSRERLPSHKLRDHSEESFPSQFPLFWAILFLLVIVFLIVVYFAWSCLRRKSNSRQYTQLHQTESFDIQFKMLSKSATVTKFREIRRNIHQNSQYLSQILETSLIRNVLDCVSDLPSDDLVNLQIKS